MHQPRGDERRQQRGRRAQAEAHQRAEDKVVDELVKPAVPAHAPELGERFRSKRLAHDRHGVHAGAAPEQREQVERAEVEQEDQADHADPAGAKRVVARGEAGEAPEEGCAASRFGNRSDPGRERRARRHARLVEKRRRVHAHPAKQICDRARSSWSTLPLREREEGPGRSQPGDPLAGEEQRQGDGPHQRPARRLRPQRRRGH